MLPEASEIQLGKKESVVDTAKVLGSMFDGIEYRGFSDIRKIWPNMLGFPSGMA